MNIILLITDKVLPESAKPYPTFTFCISHIGWSLGLWNQLHEANLDRFPSVGKIAIAWWQRPNGMHVIGQHHPGINI